MRTSSDAVTASFSTIRRVLGTTFSFRQLVAYVEEKRDKPIRLGKEVMPVGITGACLALADCDLIWTRVNLDGLRARFAALHELAHLVLGHVPCVAVGDAVPTYVQFRQRYVTVRADQVCYRMPSPSMEADEYDAEALATLFFTHLSQSFAGKTTNETQLLWYLHERLVTIAPGVCHPTLSPLRLEVEIGDAREFILSQLDARFLATAPRTQVSACYSQQDCAAYNEAYYIHTLLQIDHSFHTIGSWMPDLPTTHVRRYNIAVAHYLAQSQHRNG